MLTLTQKILLRKQGVGLSVLSIGFLVAVVTSMNSAVNYMYAESQILSRLVNVGRTYIILSWNSTSITDSRLDSGLASQLYGVEGVQRVFPQKLLKADMKIASTVFPVYVRVVENVEDFLRFKNAYINGSTAENPGEANVGEVLARVLKINLHDGINLTICGSTHQVEVVGIFTTRTGLDGEMIVPMEALNILHVDDALSVIEFSLKGDVEDGEALNSLVQRLRGGVKIVKTQQLGEFVSELNGQTLRFMSLWSLAVYAVVASASYIIASRLIAESSYELVMLKALGASKRQVFTTVLTSTAIIAILGSMLGVPLGLVGIQVASTVFRWIMPNVDVSPFLQLEQVLQTLLLAVASSIVGCLYPAYKATRTTYMEQNL